MSTNAISPIHADLTPVRAYAKWISGLKEKHVVVTIPSGSSAYNMGYRYASIAAKELDFHLKRGASLVE